MRIAYLTLALLLGWALVNDCMAQFPGHWEKHVVCTHCMPPAEFDFRDDSTGVIALVSQYIARPEIPYWARTLVTHDGGITWQLYEDTAFLPVLTGYPVKLYGERLIVHALYSTSTFYSDDFGMNLEMLWGDLADQLDVLSVDPATQFRASRIDRGRYKGVEFLVSRDSGRSYSLVNNFEDTSYNILQVRLRDTSEYWMILNPRSDLRPIKRIKLLFSKDQGNNWKEVFPIDTTSLDWGRVSLGGGTYETGYKGLLPSSTSENLYLLNCSVKIGIPGTTRYGVLYSTDQGESWIADSSHASYKKPYFDISRLHNSHGNTLWIMSADSQTIGYSSDNGAHWVHDSVTFRRNPVMNMLWKDSVTGYALTFSDDSTLSLWKYVHGTSSVEHATNAPKRFIRLAASITMSGKLRVYTLHPLAGELTAFDMLGRTVWSSTINAPRTQYIELDVPPSPGVYFLRYSEGKDTQTLRYLRE